MAQIQLAGELEAIKHRAAVHIRETLDTARDESERAIAAAESNHGALCVGDSDEFESAILDLVMEDA